MFRPTQLSYYWQLYRHILQAIPMIEWFIYKAIISMSCSQQQDMHI